MRKRLLSALLAMAMVLTMLPVSAFAVEGQVDMTDVVAANLHDTRLDITDTNSPYYGKGIADDKLYQAESYKVTAQAANGEANVVNVTVEIKDLKEHANAPSNDPTLAGWVGVGVPYIEGAQYASGWKPGVGEGALKPEAVEGFSQEVDGKKYVTRYFNASNETKKEGQILVKVGDTITTYNINLTGAKVATPSIKIGFNAAGDNANKEATAWNKEMRSDKALAITDSERNTIYAAIDGLNTRKAYTVELQYSETANGAFTKIDDFHAFGNAQTPEHKVVNTVVRKTFTPWDGSQGSDMQAELKAGFYKMVLKQGTTEIVSDPIELVEVTVDPTENGELTVVPGTDKKAPFEVIADGADKGKIKLFAVKGAEEAAFEDIITATAKTGFELDTETPWVANGEKTVFTANIEVPVPVLVVAAATAPLTDLGNKAIADLQGALSIAPADKDNVIKVTGISKYVSGWTQFSSNEDEQKGNYVALKLTSDPAGKVSIKKNNNWVALNDNIVVVLLDGPSQNKIEVALGDTTADTKAAYTIDLTGMTKQAETKPVDKVTVLGIGFEATGVAANEGIARLGGYVTDCEDNTMFVRFAGLTASKRYKVEFTNSKGELVYSSLVQDGGATENHEITGTTTSTVYFAFGGHGSPSLKPIASGVYTAKLYEKDGETWKEVAAEGTASIELNSLKIADGAPTYYKKGAVVKAPAAAAAPDGKAFAGWEDADHTIYQPGDDITVDKDVVLTAKFNNGVIAEAVIEGKVLTVVVDNEAKKVSISGLLPGGTLELTVQYKLNLEGSEFTTATVVLTKGTDKFTTTSKITTVAGDEYTVDVSGIVISEVTVVDAAPVVDVAETIKEADVTTVTTAAASTQITEINDLIASNATTVDTAVKAVTETETNKAIEDLNALTNVSGVDEKNVKVVVQPVMDVKATAYDATTKTLTLDVTAGYRLVAVKEDVAANAVKVSGDTNVSAAGANAVVVKKPVPMTVNTPVEVSVALPAGFAADGTIAVKHEKNGNHYHTATVVGNLATFTSTDGLSPFTFAAVELVAEVNGKQYATWADAIKAVENNGTIKLLADITEDVKVDRAIVFTVDANGKAGAEKIKAAEGYTLKVEGAKYTFTKNSSGGMGPMGGGASGTTTYSVNVPTTANGTVTVNPRNAAKDATVTITVAPNQGYHLDTLTVTDKDGNTIELTKVDSNKYTFKMPASRVEIKATFVEGEAPAISFTDVVEGEYYVDAVKWAVDKGITNGLTDTTFGPNASCTRAQMVTFLWRAAGSPEPTTTTTAFTDVDSNEYYYKAMLWAVEKGITKGTTDTTFAPNATVTRAQTVTFLYRYAGSPAVNGTNAFTDLEANEYYVDAVQWAATNGITTGTTETTFSPANNCTRGQIVTFLYRHIVK